MPPIERSGYEDRCAVGVRPTAASVLRKIPVRSHRGHSRRVFSSLRCKRMTLIARRQGHRAAHPQRDDQAGGRAGALTSASVALSLRLVNLPQREIDSAALLLPSRAIEVEVAGVELAQ